jgi:hypothetical protein
MFCHPAIQQAQPARKQASTTIQKDHTTNKPASQDKIRCQLANPANQQTTKGS